MIWLVFSLGAAPAAIALAVLYAGFARLPAARPESFRGRARSGERVVVCAGDSLTAATLSGDFVGLLRARRPDVRFVNAGRNGDTARGLGERTRAIEACEPDAVVVLIGTNDVRAGHDDATCVTEPLAATLASLRGRPAAVLSIPPLGERRDDDANRRVARWNDALRALAAGAGAEYLPLFERLTSRFAPGGEPYRLRVGWLLGSAFRRYLFRQSWDRIAAARGLRFLTDQIHLSDEGARAVAELVDAWLERVVPRERA